VSLAAGFDCQAVEGYEELVARSDIDAVYIALPISLHARWAIEAAKNGKHVLCEKTLSPSLRETKEILSTCKQAGVALLEGFAYQFHPQHKAFDDLVASGGIGEPVLFQAWFGFPPIDSAHRYDPSLGGGALLDAGAYTVHSARRFFRAEPAVLSADLEKGDKDVEIYGAAHLKFGKTQSALVAFGFNHMYRNCYSIWGTEAAATITRAFSIPSHFAPTMVIERQGRREEITLPPADHFRREVEAFCGGLGDESARRMWAEDALNQSIALEQVRGIHKLQTKTT
jgi:predicted dehydrogenase